MLTNRDKLLAAGRQVLHAQGYTGSGLRAIVSTAGLPLSSFNSHFGSKEAFGLEVLELYFSEHRQLMSRTLLDDTLAPQIRLRLYFEALVPPVTSETTNPGCLIGLLCAESQGLSALMQARLAAMLLQIQRSLSYCFSAAHAIGALPPRSEADELAAFVLASLQGTLLLARTYRDNAALTRCQQQLLQMLRW